MLIFLFISFIAGILTVLAPCVLPLLPVIVGGSVLDTRSRLKPYVITISLSVSVIFFTLLLKFATIFVNIPQYFWQYFSATILIFFGLITIFPVLWEKGAQQFNLLLSRKSNTYLAQGVKRESFWGDVIIGASLGPVFSSCSPTYFVILATVLPQSFLMGFIDLVFYALGLSISLLLVSKLGQKLVARLEGVTDERGWFKKVLGALFVLVGIFVATGYDKSLQTYVLNNVFDITKLEEKLLQTSGENRVRANNNTSNDGASDTLTLSAKSLLFPKYSEIAKPAGFINTDPFEIKDLIGKKVIIVDFLTYSCINCQRTFPYLNAWYSKYKDKGLEIVAIHTPEFAFEHKIENVRTALEKFGIKFPVVLDNDYGTWNAYNNQYWPHKFLIDIDGYVRYDHIGEGAYDETETQIKSLLDERMRRLGETKDVIDNAIVANTIVKDAVNTGSQETYFGAFRNAQFFGNGNGGTEYKNDFTLPETFSFNQFFLEGKWNIAKEFIESETDGVVAFPYNSQKVHLVAEAANKSVIQIQNGSAQEIRDVEINSALLYTIVSNKTKESKILYIRVPKGVRLYSLTFG